jgi:phosphopantothenate---cysteine ligase (CTP)
MDILVTAGATRNPIDAIRYLSAQSSGKTGASLASMIAERGGRVFVLGSPEACLRMPNTVKMASFGDTRDLMAQMRDWVKAHPDGAVIHSAAVGDYEVMDAGRGKISSGKGELVIRLTPTPKIANHVRSWGLRGAFVTFKAAAPDTDSEALIAIARKQREVTGSTWVFANVLGRLEQELAIVGEQTHWFDTRVKALYGLVQRLLPELD